MILVVKGGQWAGTAVAVVLETKVRERLMRTAASAKSGVRAVLRAQIVFSAADARANGAITRESAVSGNTVRKWRRRFAVLGIDGLRDAERSGRPKVYGPDVRVATATSEPPHPEATWSHRSIAERVAGTCFAPVSSPPGRPDPGGSGPDTAQGPQPARPARHHGLLAARLRRVRALS
ncbi:helix-turn-helix domain-containing protein [Streptomyces monashensis]|uniref:helix-turn-helix domain-containing protein n=1 Tax=Streptomyces monashensis TaxID=1678012 RepID=UPI000D198B1E